MDGHCGGGPHICSSNILSEISRLKSWLSWFSVFIYLLSGFIGRHSYNLQNICACLWVILTICMNGHARFLEQDNCSVANANGMPISSRTLVRKINEKSCSWFWLARLTATNLVLAICTHRLEHIRPQYSLSVCPSTPLYVFWGSKNLTGHVNIRMIIFK